MEELKSYDFGESFQRKIIALAVRSDLMVRAPSAFRADFFGSKSKTQSPRRRLARIVEDFAKEYRNERPGNETMDELVREEAARLKPEERASLEEEWREVRSIEVPDPRHVVDRVRWWARDAALANAIMTAADVVESVRRSGRQDDLREVRKVIDEALRVGETEGRGGFAWVFDDHSSLWLQDFSRRKVPTGFGSLDWALDGGPMRGEVLYMLAPPKGGKTASLLNMAINASRKRKGVAFFSYEMRKENMAMRMDRTVSWSTKQELRADPTRSVRAIEGLRSAGAGEIWIQEFVARQHGVEEAARIVEARRGMGQEIDLVVMDYLNLMTPAKTEREKRHELVAISREMAEMGKELDVVVWSAALINKKAYEKERIKKADISEASEVIAVADGLVSICAPPELASESKRRLFVAAMREEEDERDAGIYLFDRDRMVFREVPWQPKPPLDSDSEGEEKG